MPGKVAVLDNYHAIQLFYSGDLEKLNKDQLALYGMIDYAHNQINGFGGGRKTAQKIQKHWEAKGTKISIRTAYQHMEWALELDNATNRKSKDMNRIWLVQVLKDQIQANLDQEDPDLFKQSTAVARLADQLNKIEKYGEVELDLPDFSEIGGNTIEITSNPEEAGFTRVEISEELKKKYEEPKVSLAKVTEVEDVDHEEVNE